MLINCFAELFFFLIFFVYYLISTLELLTRFKMVKICRKAIMSLISISKFAPKSYNFSVAYINKCN